MREQVDVQCPNPACPDREVEGDEVHRAEWTATYFGATYEQSGEFGPDINCACGCEGIPVDDGPRIAAAEEELGRRCEECGVVTANPDGGCPHCGEAFPEQEAA